MPVWTKKNRYGTITRETFPRVEFPMYVTLGKGGSALRRIGSSTPNGKPIYHRDAGHWDIGAKIVGRGEGRSVIAWAPEENDIMHHAHKTELFPITEKEWRDDNGGWAPLGNEIAQELAYLRWFYEHCDFGPAHEDVINIMNEEFEQSTGRKVPEDYK